MGASFGACFCMFGEKNPGLVRRTMNILNKHIIRKIVFNFLTSQENRVTFVSKIQEIENMKKLCLFLGLMLAPIHGYAAQLYLGNSTSNLNAVTPGGNDGKYYKCQNSVTYSCQSNAILINYTSQVSGSGTSASPYILSGCSFVGCACSNKTYLSGTTCIECKDNAWAAPNSGDLHRNTSCQYCPSHMLKKAPAPGVVVCLDCPVASSIGTCDGSNTVKCIKGFWGSTSCSQCPPAQYQSCMGSFGTTDAAGAQNITDCYIAANGSFCDEIGQGVFTDKCSYTN